MLLPYGKKLIVYTQSLETWFTVIAPYTTLATLPAVHQTRTSLLVINMSHLSPEMIQTTCTIRNVFVRPSCKMHLLDRSSATRFGLVK